MSDDGFYILEVVFCPIFEQEKDEFIVSKLFDENSLNNFYIYISLVGIPYIYVLPSFILSLMYVYSMLCAQII